MNRSTDIRSFLPGMYPVSALLIVAPFVELLGLGWPFRPTEVAWRFGSLGLGFGTMIVQILGIALAMFTAAALGHRRALRTLAVITLMGATVMIAGIARFILDYGQLRADLPSSDLAGFDSSTFRALVSATLGIPVLLALGARALAWTRSDPPVLDRRQAADPEPHVIPIRQRRPR